MNNLYIRLPGNFLSLYRKYREVIENETVTRSTPVVDILSGANEIYVEFINNKIVINNKYIIAEPRFNTPPALLFELLYTESLEDPLHRTKTYSREDLEKMINKKLSRPLGDVVTGLNFKGQLRKAFFLVGKNSILLRGRVSVEQLKELSIDMERLEQDLLALDKVK